MQDYSFCSLGGEPCSTFILSNIPSSIDSISFREVWAESPDLIANDNNSVCLSFIRLTWFVRPTFLLCESSFHHFCTRLPGIQMYCPMEGVVVVNARTEGIVVLLQNALSWGFRRYPTYNATFRLLNQLMKTRTKLKTTTWVVVSTVYSRNYSTSKSASWWRRTNDRSSIVERGRFQVERLIALSAASKSDSLIDPFVIVVVPLLFVFVGY